MENECLSHGCVVSRKFASIMIWLSWYEMYPVECEVRWLSIKSKYALMVPRISIKIQRNHESDFGCVRLVACFALEFARLKFIYTRRTLRVPSSSFWSKKKRSCDLRLEIANLSITMEDTRGKLNLYSKISINLW